MFFESQLLACPIHHHDGADIEDRRALDQAVLPQRAAGVDQVHDPVRQSEQRRYFDAAAHRDDFHALARVATKKARVRRGYFVATRGVTPPGRAGYGIWVGLATTIRHRPKPSASGSSTSAAVSRRTSVPVIPTSAAPDSTYTGTSAGFTNSTDSVPSDEGTSSLRVAAGLGTGRPLVPGQSHGRPRGGPP